MTGERDAKPGLSRRGFLNVLWGASVAGLFGQAGVAVVRFLTPLAPAGGFGGKVDAGRVDEFKPGSVSFVQKGHFYISRLPDGSVLALWQRCTHLGCIVPWRAAEHQFHCPCHSSLFNAQGEVIGGPAPRPLDLFPIEVIDGDLVVDTGRVISRAHFDPSQALKV